MTPKTQPTTLQLARDYMRLVQELHFVNHGYASILMHVPDLSAEESEGLRGMAALASDHIRGQIDRVWREYEGRIGRRAWKHKCNLEEMAMNNAWR